MTKIINSEADFLLLLKSFFEIIGEQTNNTITRHDCFCCSWGKKFSEIQDEKVLSLGLKPNKENGDKDHFFLGRPGKIIYEAEVLLKEKLALEEGEILRAIKLVNDKFEFVIERTRIVEM